MLRGNEKFEYSILRAIGLLAFVEVITFHTALYGNTSVKVHPARSSPFLLVNMNDPREARLLARCAPQPCIRLSRHRPETMKQSFASTARLRGGGPILGTAIKTMAVFGSPPPRIVIGRLSAGAENWMLDSSPDAWIR